MLFLSSKDNIVFFFDEGRFGLQPTLGHCWSLRGLKKTVKIKPGYKNFYLYTSVSPNIGEHFTLFLPWTNTKIMNLYLKKLHKAFPTKKIFMIMDQAGWHKSKDLCKPKNIRFIYLPPYSPELNPVEKLWAWLRKHVCRNRLFESLNHLMDEIESALNKLLKTDYAKLCNCNYLLHYK